MAGFERVRCEPDARYRDGSSVQQQRLGVARLKAARRRALKGATASNWFANHAAGSAAAKEPLQKSRIPGPAAAP